MKSLFVLLVAFTFFAASMAVQDAHAQLELAIGGGLNSPLGDYGDQTNVGYGLTTSLGYRLKPLVIGIELARYGNTAPDDATASLGEDYSLTSNIQQYAAMAKLMIPVGEHNLFAKGLMGSYRGTAKLSGPLGDGKVSNTDMGFGIGGGLLINGDKPTSFFLDATYHHIAFDDEDGGTADTNFLSFSAGAVFAFR